MAPNLTASNRAPAPFPFHSRSDRPLAEARNTLSLPRMTIIAIITPTPPPHINPLAQTPNLSSTPPVHLKRVCLRE